MRKAARKQMERRAAEFEARIKKKMDEAKTLEDHARILEEILDSPFDVDDDGHFYFPGDESA